MHDMFFLLITYLLVGMSLVSRDIHAHPNHNKRYVRNKNLKQALSNILVWPYNYYLNFAVLRSEYSHLNLASRGFAIYFGSYFVSIFLFNWLDTKIETEALSYCVTTLLMVHLIPFSCGGFIPEASTEPSAPRPEFVKEVNGDAVTTKLANETINISHKLLNYIINDYHRSFDLNEKELIKFATLLDVTSYSYGLLLISYSTTFPKILSDSQESIAIHVSGKIASWYESEWSKSMVPYNSDRKDYIIDESLNKVEKYLALARTFKSNISEGINPPDLLMNQMLLDQFFIAKEDNRIMLQKLEKFNRETLKSLVEEMAEFKNKVS